MEILGGLTVASAVVLDSLGDGAFWPPLDSRWQGNLKF
jgi:hypothetical protein